MFGKISLPLLALFALVTGSELRAQEPQLSSVFPLGGRQGSVFEAEVRGQNLAGTYAVWFDCYDLKAKVQKVEEIAGDKKEGSEAKKKTKQRVLLKVEVGQSARIGVHTFRLVSGRGVSNALWMRVNSEPVMGESETASQTTGRALAVSPPVAINGKISQLGERDYYAFDALKGQELRFEVFSDWPANPPRPQLTLYQPTGSWFDAHRLTRLAFNDASIFYLPRLTYQFKKEGRYLIEVGAFYGQGGADYSYQLRISQAGRSEDSESEQWSGTVMNPESRRLAHSDLSEWRDRDFAREIKADRLQVFWSRTVREVQKRRW